MLTQDQLNQIHDLSSNNRASLSSASQAGCFFCERIFDPIEITEWARSGLKGSSSESNDAICPCGIDSVLSSQDLEKAGFKLTKELLSEMNEYWFKTSVSLEEVLKDLEIET